MAVGRRKNDVLASPYGAALCAVRTTNGRPTWSKSAENGLKVYLEYLGSILRHPSPFSRVFGADSLGVKCCSHTLLLHAWCRSGGPVPTQSLCSPCKPVQPVQLVRTRADPCNPCGPVQPRAISITYVFTYVISLDDPCRTVQTCVWNVGRRRPANGWAGPPDAV